MFTSICKSILKILTNRFIQLIKKFVTLLDFNKRDRHCLMSYIRSADFLLD